MALFDRFGGSHTFAVRAMGTSIDADGTLSGNLYLRGQGDPEVADPRLDVLASGIRNAGVRHITGHVVGVTGPFRRDWFAPGWKSYFPRYDIALPTALTFRGNLSAAGAHIHDPERRAAVYLSRALRDRGVTIGSRAAAGPGATGLTELALGALGAATHDRAEHGSSLAQLLRRGARQGARVRRRRGGNDRERGSCDLRVRGRSPRVGGVSRRLRPFLREPPDGDRARPPPLERRSPAVARRAADGVARRGRGDPAPPARRSGSAPRPAPWRTSPPCRGGSGTAPPMGGSSSRCSRAGWTSTWRRMSRTGSCRCSRTGRSRPARARSRSAPSGGSRTPPCARRASRLGAIRRGGRSPDPACSLRGPRASRARTRPREDRRGPRT